MYMWCVHSQLLFLWGTVRWWTSIMPQACAHLSHGAVNDHLYVAVRQFCTCATLLREGAKRAEELRRARLCNALNSLSLGSASTMKRRPSLYIIITIMIVIVLLLLYITIIIIYYSTVHSGKSGTDAGTGDVQYWAETALPRGRRPQGTLLYIHCTMHSHASFSHQILSLHTHTHTIIPDCRCVAGEVVSTAHQPSLWPSPGLHEGVSTHPQLLHHCQRGPHRSSQLHQELHQELRRCLRKTESGVSN